MIRYPMLSPDWWAGQAYWWDAEFWNESVTGTFATRGDRWLERFDSRTGAMRRTGSSRYALFSTSDVRFRLAGRTVIEDRGAYLFELERPWRAAWLTSGIHPDGWMRPRTPAMITVFAEPGQKQPLRRFVTLSLGSSDHEQPWPVAISTNLERLRGKVDPEQSYDRLLVVCVPPGGTGRVVIETPLVGLVYRDPTKRALTGEVDRPAGLLLRSVALADETVPAAPCPAEPVVR